ncbi:MAG: ATP-dependent sacrificial sulfur transferase LarE [Oscillospiraceae bacterium]|jgi:uncharacterized protein|nr:ATP-dependent sacrificial sulfur transferase LarE [Oscillospiraceae bacterium]
MLLMEFFRGNPRVAVAFSGGADSAYLLYAAKDAGCDVSAYFMKSRFQPQFELDDAKRLADSLDVPLTVWMLDVLLDLNIANNPPDRCYHCKSAIMSRLWELARADGYTVLCDGTNADDKETDRPGMRALRELGVSSPLRDCGLTKNDIRRLSKQADLFTHDKPPYACLATRIPTGTKITEDLLTKIERAESALFNMGFSDFRVRLIPPCGAKIQLPDTQLDEAVSRRSKILASLIPDFDHVVLDLTARRI